MQVTRQLRDASKALDIELLDHVVFGNAGADPTGVGFTGFAKQEFSEKAAIKHLERLCTIPQ